MIDLVTRSGKYRIVQSAELPHVAVLVPGNLNEEGHSTNGRTGAALIELCTEFEELRATKIVLETAIQEFAYCWETPGTIPQVAFDRLRALVPAKEPAEPPLPLGHGWKDCELPNPEALTGGSRDCTHYRKCHHITRGKGICEEPFSAHVAAPATAHEKREEEK